jgi:hypothetical protein
VPATLKDKPAEQPNVCLVVNYQHRTHDVRSDPAGAVKKNVVPDPGALSHQTVP